MCNKVKPAVEIPVLHKARTVFRFITPSSSVNERNIIYQMIRTIRNVIENTILDRAAHVHVDYDASFNTADYSISVESNDREAYDVARRALDFVLMEGDYAICAGGEQ